MNIFRRLFYRDQTKVEFSPRTDQELIEEVLNKFKFLRVRKTMQALNWRWFDEETPSVIEIRNQAKKLLTKAVERAKIQNNTVTLGIGGLEATAHPSDCGRFIKKLSLIFIISDYTAHQ